MWRFFIIGDREVRSWVEICFEERKKIGGRNYTVCTLGFVQNLSRILPSSCCVRVCVFRRFLHLYFYMHSNWSTRCFVLPRRICYKKKVEITAELTYFLMRGLNDDFKQRQKLHNRKKRERKDRRCLYKITLSVLYLSRPCFTLSAWIISRAVVSLVSFKSTSWFFNSWNRHRLVSILIYSTMHHYEGHSKVRLEFTPLFQVHSKG